MKLRWFEVGGDIDNLNSNIFKILNDAEASLNKAVKIKNRYIFLNATTGLLHAIVNVACE